MGPLIKCLELVCKDTPLSEEEILVKDAAGTYDGYPFDSEWTTVESSFRLDKIESWRRAVDDEILSKLDNPVVLTMASGKERIMDVSMHSLDNAYLKWQNHSVVSIKEN